MQKQIKTFLAFLILGIGITLFSSHPAPAQGLFIRGDINADGVVDTVDLRLWQTDIPWVNCPNRKDIDDDGDVTVGDSIYLSNYLFFGGPPPPHPFPTCGFDTTPGLYSCNTATCCTVTVECNDGVDNDGDGVVDISEDCGCSNGCDSTEAPNLVTHCNDGIDNDGDGFIDLADCGCSNTCEFSEAPRDQCRDGIDNDGDGLVDLADTNCVDSCDFNEFSLCLYKPGDFNGNGSINLTDIIGLVGHVFKGDPPPFPKCKGDANGNGSLNLTDIIYLVNFVFKNGPDPIPSVVCCIPT